MSRVLVSSIIQNIQVCKRINDEQWKHELEVDVEHIININNTDEKIRASFEELPINVKRIIDEFIGEETLTAISNRNSEAIETVLTCLKIYAFMGYKQGQVKKQYIESQLSNAHFSFIEDQTKKSQEFVSCLLMGGDYLDHFKNILHLNKAHKFSYVEFALAVDLRNVDDFVEKQELEASLETGISLHLPSVEAVDAVLSEVETSAESDYVSKCRGILQSEGEIIIFILRQDKRSSIRKVDEMVIDTSAEWTVLRFDERAKTVKIRSFFEMANEFANRILGLMNSSTVHYYVQSSKHTSKTRLVSFIQNLMAGDIPSLSIIELRVVPQNIPGNPEFTIKRVSELVTMQQSLNALAHRNNGFRLFSDIDEIIYIKFEYNTSSGNNIYQLKFKGIAGTTAKSIEFYGRGGLTRIRNIKQLLADYGVMVNEGEVEN
ncbi:hypothetical protein JJB07_01475 [Tumebacillus sp. ITR2]|uniref:Uncharacterized protein n=1 Tax=Tumebacillus amylolyticus TaxID=2801339 RepID=A0ABS1J6K0_9BACL|nr:hypothetical protein [Tumebacillus amylolyticus]MBL0385303.1 hypothetical protein [Tumebacillus amylolyticus]